MNLKISLEQNVLGRNRMYTLAVMSYEAVTKK